MKKSLEQQSRELEEKQKQFDEELYFSDVSCLPLVVTEKG